MKTLFVGTGNLNKLKEIDGIFKKNGLDIVLKCPKDFADNSDPVEDGLTFIDNATIKAEFYFNKYHLPCIGEDSGITIEYFNNEPGVHSKRFLGFLNDHDKNEYILRLMKGVKNRKACFHTAICYIDENGTKHIFEGRNEGEISTYQAGNEGFGYDPIFYIPSLNKTEAELGLAYKNEHSHRAVAMKKFVEYLRNEE